MASLKKNRKLYWGLISTFAFLWGAVAFVSTLHAIAFFQITNSLLLAILLGTAYEIGQMAVLFSILMTENKNRLLAWSMLFLLTGLQVTANVYASFRFMEMSGTSDWTFWQRAVLLGVEFDDPEMYKIIISWISGALLPVVALGLTALVADNIAMVRREKEEELEEEKSKEKDINMNENESTKDDIIKNLEYKLKEYNTKEKTKPTLKSSVIEEESDEDNDYILDIQDGMLTSDNKKEPIEEIEEIKDDNLEELNEEVINDEHLFNIQESLNKEEQQEKEEEKQKIVEPVNKPRGWHFKNEFIDNIGNVFKKGVYSHTIPKKEEESPPKKVWGRLRKK